MKTLTQYREDIKNLMKKVADIDAQCVNQGREITEAELALKNEILDEVENIRKIVAAMERHERIQKAIDGPAEPAQTVQSPSRPERAEDRSRDRFNSLGEQLSAVIRAATPGGSLDPRLLNATGMSEGVNSDGGFLIQQDFTQMMVEDLFDNSLILSQCEQIPISSSSNSIKVPGYDETSRASTRFGGVVIYHVGEGGTITKSKPKFRNVELNLHKLAGLCYLTEEMVQDAPAMESRISSAFTKAINFQVQDDIINGTGAGMALGVMNAGSLVTVAKETNQGAATILPENIVNMYSRRFAAETGNYAWYYNQDIEPQLFTMTLQGGTAGTPIFMPPGGLSDTPYARIMGRPAYAIEQCQTLGTAGDIIFGNFRDGYVTANKGGIRQDISIHVQFLTDEQTLRFILRFDGQPWRASALTPAKGSNTQSHFIVLADRS